MSKQQKELGKALNVGSLELTEELIRKRAYRLLEQRGYEHGYDVADWLQAEAEVMGKTNRKESATESESTQAAAAAA